MLLNDIEYFEKQNVQILMQELKNFFFFFVEMFVMEAAYPAEEMKREKFKTA